MVYPKMWIKSVARRCFPTGSFGRWLIATCYPNPRCVLACFLRSLRATRALTGRYFPVKVMIGPHAKLAVQRGSAGQADIRGSITCFSWGPYRSESSISLGGTLRVHNEFLVGPDSRIFIKSGAVLEVGNGRSKKRSCIQASAVVLVENLLDLGADSVIGTGCFITDSDWHFRAGSERSAPIRIGEHVWLPHAISVLKGAVIPDGCIVAARSVVRGGEDFPEKSLIAGAPARLRKTGVEWDW